MQKLKENSLDFFTQGKIEQVKSNSTIHVMYAMFLYTIYKTFNFKSLSKIALIIALGFGIYYVNKLMDVSNQKDAIHQSEVFKENVENVSKITPQKIAETVVFLDNARDKEIARLTQMYWIIKYLDKKGDLYNHFKSAINELQQAIVKAKDHYAKRKLELVQTYSLVQQKKYSMLKQTYDDKNPLGVVISLVNANTLKSDYVTQESAKVIQENMEKVVNPEELNIYLANNKDKMKQELIIFEK